MCRRDHPSFPSEITCCFLSVLKTLLMPSEPIRALSGVNVPGFPMAGFQLTLYGRFWATPEGHRALAGQLWFWVVWVVLSVLPSRRSPFSISDRFFYAFTVAYIVVCTRTEHDRATSGMGGSDPRVFWAAVSRPERGRSRPIWTFSHGDFPFPLLRISPCFKHFGLPAVKAVAISSMQSATFTFFTRAQQNQH